MLQPVGGTNRIRAGVSDRGNDFSASCSQFLRDQVAGQGGSWVKQPLARNPVPQQGYNPFRPIIFGHQVDGHTAFGESGRTLRTDCHCLQIDESMDIETESLQSIKKGVDGID